MKDVLYTDWTMEHPDPWWCDECGAEDTPSNCTCETQPVGAPKPPPLDKEHF